MTMRIGNDFKTTVTQKQLTAIETTKARERQKS